MQNPYLEEFLAILPDTVEEGTERKEERVKLCWRYAWSVPTEETIAALVHLSPLIELGAGSGYWASLVRDAGGEIAAYDANPPGLGDENRWHDTWASWTPVERGSLAALDSNADKTLFLCWPPYSDQVKPEGQPERRQHMAKCMAYQALRRWKGNRVVYVGEWRCCTAGWAFHDLLDSQWLQIDELPVPCWPGVTDSFKVFERLDWSVEEPLAPVDAATPGARPAPAPAPAHRGTVEVDEGPMMKAIPLPALYEKA